jgi:hypothetical protein
VSTAKVKHAMRCAHSSHIRTATPNKLPAYRDTVQQAVVAAGRVHALPLAGVIPCGLFWCCSRGGRSSRAAEPRSVGHRRVWQAQTEPVPAGLRYQIFEEESLLTFRELFGLLEESSAFARWYSETLAAAPFSAFFWEHPPINDANFDAHAELVLIESASLAGLNADPEAFEGQFSAHPDATVLTFPNLGADALLIVPRPLGTRDAYPHLAAFLRHAPDHQAQDLWRAAALTLREHLGSTPRWLSTAGLGVPWLHLRLDTQPKYYRYSPYATALS